MNNTVDFLGRAGIIMLIVILASEVDNYSWIFRGITLLLVLMFFIAPFTNPKVCNSKLTRPEVKK